ncbi:MAG: 30S ribosomal protein S16 [Patescibacteria group bacterium]
MLMIRFSRFGSNHKPTWRLIVSEKSKDTHGKVMEYLGSYNARSNPKTAVLKADRIKFWMARGAQPSASVNNLLVKEGILTKKVRAWRPKKKEQKPGDNKPAVPAAEVKPATADAVAPAEAK